MLGGPEEQGAVGQALYGPDFLLSVLLKGRYFLGLSKNMMLALKGLWLVLIRAGKKVNIGPMPALHHKLITSPFSCSAVIKKTVTCFQKLRGSGQL